MKIVKNNVNIVPIVNEEELDGYGCIKGKHVLPIKQKYFGMLVSNIGCIIPRTSADLWGHENDELVYFYDYSNIAAFSQRTPLIFRVLEDKCGNQQYAQEIMTGKLFTIGEYNELYDMLSDKDCSLEYFQSKFDMCKNNPLVISNDDNGSFYPVNEKFKQLYANHHRGHEEEYKEIFDEIETNAKELFNEKLNKIIEEAKDSAYTDNIIYNYEMRLKK